MAERVDDIREHVGVYVLVAAEGDALLGAALDPEEVNRVQVEAGLVGHFDVAHRAQNLEAATVVGQARLTGADGHLCRNRDLLPCDLSGVCRHVLSMPTMTEQVNRKKRISVLFC